MGYRQYQSDAKAREMTIAAQISEHFQRLRYGFGMKALLIRPAGVNQANTASEANPLTADSKAAISFRVLKRKGASNSSPGPEFLHESSTRWLDLRFS